jgi:hypothetical protein
VWKHPLDASEWVYVGTDLEEPRLAAVSRFPIEAPEKRELVWNRTPVSLDTFQVSTDGRRAASLFPWPEAGIAELPNGPLPLDLLARRDDRLDLPADVGPVTLRRDQWPWATVVLR